MKYSFVQYICVGVYLSLKGTVYANNSVIPITEIGRLIIVHPTLHSSASLTGCHVVQLHQTELDIGTFLMGQQLFHYKAVLQHFIETGEIVEQST